MDHKGPDPAWGEDRDKSFGVVFRFPFLDLLPELVSMGQLERTQWTWTLQFVQARNSIDNPLKLLQNQFTVGVICMRRR